MLADGTTLIPNHFTHSLSELDLQMVRSVPPGGNWKNIPESVPSKRLEQIRRSYREGKGSRSTYYGRLAPDAPSYTINTYFNRPGNGCHIHYDYKGGQHRVISQREAARLQSFPDSIVFLGSRASVNKQIGNAVPPLLAYQIARGLTDTPFRFVDLFCGAGGLSLGFSWAEWHCVAANDIDPRFLATYRHNLHESTVCGDIRDGDVFAEVRELAAAQQPLFVLGGPPCQGFSTAGRRRSLSDSRNHLFRQYKKMLEELRPAGFLFENVPGLLNMERGAVLEMITEELKSVGYAVEVWKLRAERYAVPQRRTRVFLVGRADGAPRFQAPPPVTAFGETDHLPYSPASAITAREALSDLPALVAGEDGSEKDYLSGPRTLYQRFVRGILPPDEFLARLMGAKQNA